MTNGVAPRPSAHRLITYVGVACGCAGLGLIVLAWGLVAGTTQVDRQIPPLIAAGMLGLALIVIGVAVINVAATQEDRYERARQMDRLASLLEEGDR